MGAKHLRIGWFRGPSAAARTYLENFLGEVATLGKYSTSYHVHLYNCTVLQLSMGGTRYCTINCNGYYVHLYNSTVLKLSMGGTRYCAINCNGYYVHLYNCTLQLSLGGTKYCTINCIGYVHL